MSIERATKTEFGYKYRDYYVERGELESGELDLTHWIILKDSPGGPIAVDAFSTKRFCLEIIDSWLDS